MRTFYILCPRRAVLAKLITRISWEPGPRVFALPRRGVIELYAHVEVDFT